MQKNVIRRFYCTGKQDVRKNNRLCIGLSLKRKLSGNGNHLQVWHHATAWAQHCFPLPMSCARSCTVFLARAIIVFQITSRDKNNGHQPDGLSVKIGHLQHTRTSLFKLATYSDSCKDLLDDKNIFHLKLKNYLYLSFSSIRPSSC